MKKLVILVFMLMPVYILGSEANKVEVDRAKYIAETISMMEEDGYITSEDAELARIEYLGQGSEKKKWSIKNFKMINILKTLGVIGFLLAFNGIIRRGLVKIWEYIILIPTIYYQLGFLFVVNILAIFPFFFQFSEGKYVALFGVIGNFVVIGWIYNKYEYEVEELYSKYLSRFEMVNTATLAAFIYLSFFTIIYRNNLIGALAVSSLLFFLGLIFEYSDLLLIIGTDSEERLTRMLIVNFVIVSLYGLVVVSPIELEILSGFEFGIEHICTIALGLCLLIGTAPSYREVETFKQNIVVLILSIVVSLVWIAYLDKTTVPKILNTFYLLTLTPWLILYFKKKGFIILSLVMGTFLYSVALLIEHFPDLFIVSTIFN